MRQFDELDPRFKMLAIELVARCIEAGIPVMIIDTVRSHEQELQKIAEGTSALRPDQHSKHELGLAIDICPYETFALHGPDKLRWDTNDDVWMKLGLIGEKLGLRWGGRWKRPYDPGHFELVIKA